MIQLIIIIALVGYGFQLMLNHKDNMIFGFYELWLVKLSKKNKFWHWITKPLGLCIICNTTWIGFLISAIFYQLAWWQVLCIGIAAAGLANFIQLSATYLKNHLKP